MEGKSGGLGKGLIQLNCFLTGEEYISPEALVFGARLKCMYGSDESYLFVDGDVFESDGLPRACVTDSKPGDNIRPFGTCNREAPCEFAMDLEAEWENPEPQSETINNKEIITLKSFLICKHTGMPIEPQDTGQDGEFADFLKFLMDMDADYPGLRALLEDPYGSLYLKDGMYEKALNFLSDIIISRGNSISLANLDATSNPRDYYILAAMYRLIPAYTANDKSENKRALELLMLNTKIKNGASTEYLDEKLLAQLKAYCKKYAGKVKKGGFAYAQEKNKKYFSWGAEAVTAFAYAAVAYANAKNGGIKSSKAKKGTSGGKKSDSGVCFVAGTLVSTREGFKPIENILIGEYILSQNIHSYEINYKKVKKLFVNQTKSIVQIITESEVIETTESHLFYISDKKWVQAKDLTVNNKLVTKCGFLSVKKIRIIRLNELIKVYNFEVEKWHTYFVTNHQILVHNDCSTGAKRWNKGSHKTAEQSLKSHYKKHGAEVNAKSAEQYLRKATEFARNLKGATSKSIGGYTQGVTRYYKNGKYIDIASDGSIISFGKK